MAKQNKIIVTFSKKYTQEYEHAQTKTNMSRYIAELIRQDMEQEPTAADQQEMDKIKRALRSVLDTYNFTAAAEQDNDADDLDGLLNDLFNV